MAPLLFGANKENDVKIEELKALREVGPFITKWNFDYAPGETTLAWVNAEGAMCHYFLSCKDYVHDILNAAINKANFLCCGYDGKVALDLSTTRLAVGFGYDEPEKDDKVLKVINFLHAIEREQGFSLTKLRYGGVYTPKKSPYMKDDPKNYVVWVFEGDRRWMHASPLISFYCMCIRLGFDYDGSNWSEFMESGKIVTSDRDRVYCNDSKGFWKKLIGRPVSEVFGKVREKNYPPGFVTHEKGFRWMAQLTGVPAAVPHWADLKKLD